MRTRKQLEALADQLAACACHKDSGEYWKLIGDVTGDEVKALIEISERKGKEGSLHDKKEAGMALDPVFVLNKSRKLGISDEQTARALGMPVEDLLRLETHRIKGMYYEFLALAHMRCGHKKSQHGR